MELKRNLFNERIYSSLREKHIIFFTSVSPLSVSDYLSFKIFKIQFKDDDLKCLVEDLLKIYIPPDNVCFLNIFDYTFVKILIENKNLSILTGKELIIKINDSYILQPQKYQNSSECELNKEYFFNLKHKFTNLNYNLLSPDDLKKESKYFSELYLDFINIYIILYNYYKYIQYMTLLEYSELVKYDMTLLVLYCDVIISFSDLTKDNLIHMIINYFKKDPNTDPHLLVLLIILGYNYDKYNLDIFNKKEYHYMFTSNKSFLSDYFKGLIHQYDFDEFSLIHTIIYSFTKRDFRKEITIRADLISLTSLTNQIIYMLNIFRSQFSLKVKGTKNYIISDEYTSIINILDNILNCYYLINECFYRHDDEEISDKVLSINDYSKFNFLQESFNIEVDLDKTRTILIKTIFEKTTEYRKCIIFLINYVSKLVKNQKVSYLNLNFDVRKLNKRSFSSEILFFREKTVLNMFVDLYTILSHEGEICSYMKDLLESIKYSLYSKAFNPNLLRISFNTISFEKVIDKIAEKVIISEKLFSFKFKVIEFNICINSENGFEIFELITSELYSRINRDEILISIKLYEENPVYLKINKSKETVRLSFPQHHELTSSVSQLIFYLFSLISNVLQLNKIEIDVKLGEYFAVDEDMSFFVAFKNISLNFFNCRENINFMLRILKRNENYYFREIKLIYFPIFGMNILLNYLRKLRCDKLTLNIILNDNEKEELSNIGNTIKSLFSLQINIINLSFMLKKKETFIEMKSIMIKEFDKNKYIHCDFYMDEHNTETYQNLETYNNWNMEKIDEFSLDPKDFLTKTIVKMKDPFYNFLYLVNTKKYKNIRKGPILKTVHDSLCHKVFLLGELWKIKKL